MKHTIILTCLLFLNIPNLFAQGGSAPVSFTSQNNSSILRNLVNENDNYGRVVMGYNRSNDRYSIQLFDSEEGIVNIYTKDGKAYKIPEINYDLVTQQLFARLEDGKFFNFDVNNVDYFVKNNKKYVFVENAARPLHEEILVVKDVKLLKGFKILKKEAMTNPLTNEVTEPAHYVKDEVYFMKSNDGYIEVPKKEKKFVKMFDDKKDEIKDYIKSNDLSVKDENDLVRIIQYSSTL